jgi:hypothetical protein
LILQGLGITLTAVTLGVAIWGLNTWKKEHVGKRKLELLENIYPHLKRLQTNIPLLLRVATTNHEISLLKREAKNNGRKPKAHYSAMDCIDFRMQYTFKEDFEALIKHTFFADMYLNHELQETYYVIAQLNLYFPVEFNSKTETEILSFQNGLQKRVDKLSEHLLSEIRGGM